MASNMIKNKIMLSARNARRVVTWSIIMVKMYVRCREIGSLDSLLWLARRVGAVSQQVKTRRGDEISSIVK